MQTINVWTRLRERFKSSCTTVLFIQFVMKRRPYNWIAGEATVGLGSRPNNYSSKLQCAIGSLH